MQGLKPGPVYQDEDNHPRPGRDLGSDSDVA
jgi:hypothetical protein